MRSLKPTAAMGFFEATLKILKQLRKLLAPFEFVGKKVAIMANYALLTFVYFTAFAATAIAGKVMRKHFMELKADKARKSYWIDKKQEDYTKKEAYRPF